MATRTLTVNLVGRTDKLDRSFKNASRGADTMAGKLMKATRMAGIGFGALAGVAVGAAAALKPMIDKAASMEESLSKNRVVFGESSKAIEAFAETSLHSFGVTERAALEATGVIGTLGTAMGMTATDSAEMATTLVGLAGDMSSFNDASVEETLTAIQAGLRGEAEPLRRFGVLLDAATLKAKALEQGIITSTKDALTPQQKALAAYAVILEQTTVQMGDFERTADSATNQSKLLAGEWDKIQTQIGEALLPAFTTMVTFLNDEVMPAIREFFEDPSWAAAFQLGADAATSEFTQAAGSTLGNVMDWFINPVGSAMQQGYGMLFGYFTDAGDGAKKAYLEELLPDINESWAAKPNWDPEDWAAGGTAAGTTFGAAALAAAVAAGGGLFPGGGGMPGSGVPGADPDLPEGSTPPPGSGHPAGPPPSGSGPEEFGPGPFPRGGGMPASGVTDFTRINPNTGLNAEQALRMLSDPTIDFSRFLVPPVSRSGGESGVATVNNTFNITGVSPTEVMDAIGQEVALNGPLPPHWQQGAN